MHEGPLFASNEATCHGEAHANQLAQQRFQAQQPCRECSVRPCSVTVGVHAARGHIELPLPALWLPRPSSFLRCTTTVLALLRVLQLLQVAGMLSLTRETV